jgi:phosphate transport system protein
VIRGTLAPIEVEMSKHLARDLEKLEDELVVMSSLVEEMMEKAVQSFLDRRPDIARSVIDSDEGVDQREVHIEEECLKILALHQPVAIDLRRTATVLKVNNDLERIADLAVNVAERSIGMDAHREFSIPDQMEVMYGLARRMFRSCLDALIDLDTDTANKVCLMDDEVDLCNEEIINGLYQGMKSDIKMIQPALHCLSVTRDIERMADLATNIAEDVIYLVHGSIARHRHAQDSA